MSDEQYMSRCFELASRGHGRVAPNPLVGSVIVNNDLIIGEGYHQVYGGPHAEVNAIQNAIANGYEDQLSSSTIYVNLEPCSHFGKTPPCSDLIIQKKIKRVVIANQDPFTEVNGKGIERLKSNNIDVTSGILADTGRELNKRFFTYQEKKRPYVILKFAQSEDGFIAHEIPTKANQQISNILASKLVHQWRAEEQAILVGTKTALIDNPSLTVRLANGTNPLRIAIDRNLQIPKSFALYDSKAPTWIMNEEKNETDNNVSLIKLNFEQNLIEQVLDKLYQNQIQSVLVEGGRNLLQQFIELKLWDEARVITAPIKITKGLASPVFTGRLIAEFQLAGDRITIYKSN
jgi:diaminohydroxyphosphoribosylaminopyrimidine deaminase/5-amino-6-(5-phosphoribosylamino)uracil reductase